MRRIFLKHLHILFSFLHYVLPHKGQLSIKSSQSIEYDDVDDDVNADEESISDSDYEAEKSNTFEQNVASISQILIVARLLGKREFILCRNGTKKFLNKVRQYQELSQIHKANDVNYGARMGKAAEILCKIATHVTIKRTFHAFKRIPDANSLKNALECVCYTAFERFGS